MLARTFLNAKALKVSEVERQAALTLLDMLERGKLSYQEIKIGRHCTPERIDSAGRIVMKVQEVVCPRTHGGLNMAWWGEDKAGPFCGCMGGWMERIKKRQLSERCINSWDDLFQPPLCETYPQAYTPERCARALHSKLTTGKAQWE